MKRFYQFLSMLLLLALLVPAGLAEETEDTTTAGVSLYSINTVAAVDDTLYTVSENLDIYRYADDGLWYPVVPFASFADLSRTTDDYSIYGDVYSVALTADSDGESLLLFYPYSDGVCDVLHIPLNGDPVTRVQSFHLTDTDQTEDQYVSYTGAAFTGDYVYTLVYGLSDTNIYGLNVLYELNLQTGSVRKITEDYLAAVLPLDDDSLIGYYTTRYSANDAAVSIVRVDRKTGMLETLCELDGVTDYSGFAMSNGTLFMNDGSRVYRVAAPYDTLTVIGYLPPSYVYSTLPGCILGTTYYTYNYENGLSTVDLTADLPAIVLRIAMSVSISSYNEDELIRKYAKEHPNVGIVYVNVSASTAPEYTQHMQSDEALDIYSFSLPDFAFPSLRDKGYLADLSSSSTLLQSVSEMFPNLTESILLDGSLYALPYSLSAATVFTIDTEVLEGIGLTKDHIPSTWLDFLNLVEQWLTTYADDYPEYSLVDYPDQLYYQFFANMLVCQISECEASGREITFNDPNFIAALKKLESLRTLLDDYESEYNESTSTTSWMNDYSSTYTQPLLSTYGYIDIVSQSYYAWSSEPTTKNFFLSIDPDSIGYALGTLSVMAVNRSSKNVDAAIDLFEYIANNRTAYQKALLSPAYTDNIPNDNYEDTKKSYEDAIAQLEEDMAKADESEKNDYASYIADMKNILNSLSPYAYTTESIKAYDEEIAHLHDIKEIELFNTANESSTLIGRFIDGNLTAEQFVKEMTRVVQMMILERN